MVLLKPLRQGRGVGFGGDRRDVGTRGARALGLSPYVSESTSCKSTSCERLDTEGGRCDEALHEQGSRGGRRSREETGCCPGPVAEGGGENLWTGEEAANGKGAAVGESPIPCHSNPPCT